MNRLQAKAAAWRADDDEPRWLEFDRAMCDLVERIGTGTGPWTWVGIGAACLEMAAWEILLPVDAAGVAVPEAEVWQGRALRSAAELALQTLDPANLRALRALAGTLARLNAGLGKRRGWLCR
jgi:hypothetical protein